MKNLLKKVELKKFSSVFLTLSLLMQIGVFIPLTAEALPPVQTIFEDGFESPTNISNWISSGWNSNSSGHSVGKSANSNGSGGTTKTLEKSIPTTGYEDINVTFWYKTLVNGNNWAFESSGSGRDDFYVEWWNGSSWETILHLVGPAVVDWNEQSFNLNSNANNNSNFKLRFKTEFSAATENIYIDDVKITGTEIAKVADQKISPILECVADNGDGTYTAHFGYENKNEMEVEIPVGNNNKITGGGLVGMDQGQTTTFLYPVPNHPDGRPGRTPFDDGAFQVDFDGTNLVWSLKGPDGNNRTATASSGSKACPEEPKATVVAQKVVCESEEYLPNWGNGGANITPTTAQDYVDQSNGKCSLAEWDFEWAPSDEEDPKTLVGPAGGNWTTFSGSVQVSPAERIWLREVMKDGYIPFSGWIKSGENTPTEQDEISAEFYCNTDVLNYDNYEWIDNLVAGETYHCVGFNAPVEKPLICDPNVNLIENGDFETPVVTHNAKWDIFPHGTTGLGWNVKWFGGNLSYGQSERPETALLELHRGVNSWNTSGGDGNLQYAELDSDWFGPDVNVQNEPASIKIWQTIKTIPNKNYKLTFDYSPRPNTNQSENILGVLWGGEMATTTARSGSSNTNWTTHTLNLTATTTHTSIMFRDEGTPNSLGTFVDNVGLYCVEEAVDPCTYGTQVFYSDENHIVGEGMSVETWDEHTAWLGGVPTTSPAIWMWSDEQVQNPTQDEVKVFTKTFNLDGVPTSALLSIAADNGYKVVINGDVIASTTPLQEKNFLAFTDYDVANSLVYGENTIEITVHNWALSGSNYQTNPAGVIYALYVDTKLCPGDNPHEPNKLQVKIYKYLDGEMATEDSANGYSFPMHSTWSWPSSPQKQGSSGSGDYFLNQNGHGGSGSYSAYTSVMNAPASYSTYEKTTDIDQNSNVLPIGAQCQNGMFRLLGYRVGDTLEDAENADLQTTNPSLNGLQNDMYIIVENETCPSVSTITMCKYDESQNPLTGWTLMLLGDLKDSVSVYPDGNNYNSISLEESNYVLLANGTYVYRPSNPTASTSDAAYSLRLASDSVYGGPYIPWVRVNDFPLSVQGWLGIQVNESYTDWGSIFNPNHVYAHSTSTSGTLSFRILDDVYSDNSGSLSVDIYEGFAGVTGENGCVTFENVPYGTYEADEIMKDGWSYLSGKGTVVIDSEDEAISIFNTTDLPELVCEEGELFVEGQCVKDNNEEDDEEEDNGPVIQTLTDDTGSGTTPPGGRRRDISGLFSSQGSVLGASTDDEGLMCEPYLKEYIKFGAKNNPDEVRKLQIFLNQFFELDNPVTGFYGPITFEMVKKFQAHQEAGTLIPWAVAGVPTDGPTGYVYKTTKRWINILKCPEMLATTPIPQLP